MILSSSEAPRDHSPARTDELVCAMSVIKMVVALAFGRFVDNGILASIDTPVDRIFPEWPQGRKRDDTVRMVLGDTSGPQNHSNAAVAIEPSPGRKSVTQIDGV